MTDKHEPHRRFHSRPAKLLLAGVLLLLLAGVAWALYRQQQKSQLYAAGTAAAAAGRWGAAFVQLDRLLALDPDYQDVQQRHAAAARQALATVPGGADLEAERRLIHWLAATGDEATLAEMLDRCVVALPAGEFLMGSDDGPASEHPLHRVTLDAFTISRYEVTQVQYRRFLQATGRAAPPYWPAGDFPPGQAAYPVVGVSWADADAYCTWAGGRLPTEAEWERACRGTDGRRYPWGETWDPARANVTGATVATREAGVEFRAMPWGFGWERLQATPGTAEAGPRPVGSYPGDVSPEGVVDLAGNVSEWVWDWYNWGDYSALPTHNPRSLGPTWNRVIRGSSWYQTYGLAEPAQALTRCAARNSSHGKSYPYVGFRCVQAAP